MARNPLRDVIRRSLRERLPIRALVRNFDFFGSHACGHPRHNAHGAARTSTVHGSVIRSVFLPLFYPQNYRPRAPSRGHAFDAYCQIKYGSRRPISFFSLPNAINLSTTAPSCSSRIPLNVSPLGYTPCFAVANFLHPQVPLCLHNQRRAIFPVCTSLVCISAPVCLDSCRRAISTHRVSV